MMSPEDDGGAGAAGIPDTRRAIVQGRENARAIRAERGGGHFASMRLQDDWGGGTIRAPEASGAITGDCQDTRAFRVEGTGGHIRKDIFIFGLGVAFSSNANAPPRSERFKTTKVR